MMNAQTIGAISAQKKFCRQYKHKISEKKINTLQECQEVYRNTKALEKKSKVEKNITKITFYQEFS